MTTTLTTKATALQPWGERADIRELSTRLRVMLPGGGKLDEREITALAQGAVSHGLDPLNGEIWMIPGRGLMVGIKGLRKKAHDQVRGNFWTEFRLITTDEERLALRVPPGAMAYEARLFDTENITTYTDAVAKLSKAGIPWEVIERMVGSKPYTVGYGVLKAGEKTVMDPTQCAMKRAEADAIKRRFDVGFGMEVSDDEPGAVAGFVVEAEATEITEETYVPDQAAIDAELAEAKAKRKADVAAMYTK